MVAGFSATAKINRKDWDMNFDAVLKGGELLVSDKITLEIDIEAVKARRSSGSDTRAPGICPGHSCFCVRPHRVRTRLALYGRAFPHKAREVGYGLR
jgi:hypothetical protein